MPAGRRKEGERLEEEGDDVTCPVSISNYPTESKKGPKHGEDLNNGARSIRLGQDLQLSGNSSRGPVRQIWTTRHKTVSDNVAQASFRGSQSHINNNRFSAVSKTPETHNRKESSFSSSSMEGSGAGASINSSDREVHQQVSPKENLRGSCSCGLLKSTRELDGVSSSLEVRNTEGDRFKGVEPTRSVMGIIIPHFLWKWRPRQTWERKSTFT